MSSSELSSTNRMENPTPTSVLLVESLSPRQYQGNISLYDVKLSKSIHTIPRECFQGCVNLKRIFIPQSVTSIHFKAFANSGVEEVIFETGSCLRVISARCFEMCSQLTTITLPSTIRTIGYNSFRNCLALTVTISFTTNIQEIGAHAFSGCGLDHFEICASERTPKGQIRPHNLMIGFRSFQGCPNLQSLSFPSYIHSNKSIGSNTDSEKVDRSNTLILTSTLPIFASENLLLINIGRESFSYCKNLKSITIPPSIISIGRRAFCFSTIESVEFSRDFQPHFISNGMFFGCCNLKDVTLSPSITSIRDSAFYQCTISDEVFTRIFKTCVIKYVGRYVFSCTSKLKSITIPPSITSIGEYSFSQSTIANITFPENTQLRAIPDSMFSNCYNLKSIIIPSSIESIGEGAFSYSSIDAELFSQIFTDSYIKHIGKTAFVYCKNLKSATIPSSVISIGKGAFSHSNIETTTFSSESQLQVIPDSMFSNCNQLKTFLLPPSVKVIGNRAFELSGIDYVSASNIFSKTNIQHLGEYAFASCHNIHHITIPSSIKSIGKAAFTKSSLSYIKFSEDVQLEAIPDNLFAQCYNLGVVMLSSSVKSLGENVFEKTNINDDSFEYIFTSGGNIQHIGNGVFSHCQSLKSVIIPSSVTSMGNFVFSSSTIEKVVFSEPSQLEVIPSNTFSHCEELKVVSLPQSVRVIDTKAFYRTRINNAMLTNILKSSTIQHIGSEAFAGCDLQLRKINTCIPSSITSIDEYAFVEKEQDENTQKQGIFSKCVIN